MQEPGSGWRAIAALLVALTAPSVHAAAFIRGDANGDGKVDIADPSLTLDFLFLGRRAPDCRAAADANDDETINIADPIATLEALFRGTRALPPPWPSAGADPTPGIGCGLEPPASLSCQAAGPAVNLRWTPAAGYDAIEVTRDGLVVAELSGAAGSHADHPPRGGTHNYEVRGVAGGEHTEPASCRITGLPDNRPPALQFLQPAAGAVIALDTAAVRARATDDGAVVAASIQDAAASLAGAPGFHTIAGDAALRPGPNLIRVKAADDFGRSASAALPAGRPPILLAGAASLGVAVDLSATGYDEVEAVLQPFLAQVPAVLDGAIRGAVLFDGSIAGVDVRVTGNRVEVPGAITFDLFPAADGGGRVGMSAVFERLILHADGLSDFGFLGTDRWTARWDGRGIGVRTALALAPAGGGSRLEVTADAFTVTIVGSDLTVDGFLDPFGIFDGLVNFLAGLFRGEIESRIRSAVQGLASQQLIPVLEEAFSSLQLDLELGPVALATSFHDALESPRGLSLLFNAAWTGRERDPGFPRYPGSRATLAPFPGFPLAVPAPHAVDAAITFSADNLHQAFAELAAAGLIATDADLSGVDAPLPLDVGTLAGLLDPRLAELPGVSAAAPLALRVRAEFPPGLRLGEGSLGRPLLGQGAVWRYFKGRAEPPASWRTIGFDDAAWERGPSGFGYSSDAEERRWVRTPLPDMEGNYVAVLARAAFDLPNPASLGPLICRIACDDGFAAYLNGTEIARSNLASPAGSPPPVTAVAEAAIEPAVTEIDLTPFRSLLRTGKNVLAVQGHNAGAASSDFLLVPEIVEMVPLPPGVASAVPAVLELEELSVVFQADARADGAGDGDADGVPDEVDLFSFRLAFGVQTRVLLGRDAAGRRTLAFDVAAGDGPDADAFPDAIVGGPAGLAIAVGPEAIDLPDDELVQFAQFLIALLGPALGDALASFDLPAFPLPELAFDLNGDGSADVRLDLRQATLGLAETNGDRQPDWFCILADLEPVPP